MKRPPSMRYLGIEVGVPPRRMLGLPDGAVSDAEIASALARQRTRIDRHPAGLEPEADALRRELEAAAAALRAELAAPPVSLPLPAPPAPTPQRPPPVTASPSDGDLTEFDRLVLATLATEGGWNSASRARLVAIAARFGVSAEGLVKVLEGIRRAARTGSLRRRPDRVAGAVAELAALRSADGRLAGPVPVGFDAASVRAGRGDPAANAVWLTLGFVAVAAIGLWFLARVMLADRAPAPPPPPSPAEIAERERLESPPEVPVEPRVDPSRPMPVRWSRRPSMSGGDPPVESVADAGEAGAMLERLARLARKNELAPGRPADVDRREWAELVARIGGCWPLLEPSVRTAFVEASLAVLRPLEDDRVAEGYLEPLAVDPRPLAREPLGPWRGSFAAGLLAECAARGSMPPAISAAAADRLVAAVPRKVLASERGGTPAFELGAAAWLDRGVRELVAATPGDAGAAARWERWIEAGRRLRGEAAFERSVLDAIDAILREPRLDPVPEGEASELLGRLVDEVDWTTRSPVRDEARAALSRWFVDASIAATRLWALTTLLDLDADATWFVPELVLPPQADPAGRERTVDWILAAWPASAEATPAGGGLPVDAAILERWRLARERVVELPASDGFGRVRAVVAASWLNAAGAALAAGDAAAAGELLGEIDGAVAADPVALARGGPAPGMAVGGDGEFKAALEAASRNLERQREQLRNLRMRTVAGDLGPVDAEALVQKAFFASDPSVRALAQDVIAERFANGVTVLTELLDQFPNPARSNMDSEFLGKVTGSALPEIRDPDWMRAGRHALVRKIRRLERAEAIAVDALAARYAESIDVRSRIFATGYEAPLGEFGPDGALVALARQWRMRAGTMFLSDPFPAPLDELDRRREVRRTLADGPIRRCAAESLSLLELMAAVSVAEEPGLRGRIAAILATVVERRAGAGSALGQLLESELGIAAVLDARFRPGGVPADGEEPAGGEA